mgnify:CR=1 FL=1
MVRYLKNRGKRVCCDGRETHNEIHFRRDLVSLFDNISSFNLFFSDWLILPFLNSIDISANFCAVGDINGISSALKSILEEPSSNLIPRFFNGFILSSCFNGNSLSNSQRKKIQAGNSRS